jgi:hypothetical protein
MKARLMSKGLFRIINGTELRESCKTDDAKQSWDEKAEKAAGELYLAVDDDLQAKLDDLLHSPPDMWKKLESECISKRPGARFNAYDDLLQIRKKEDESLTDLCTRVDAAMRHIKSLRPKAFTIEDLDSELEAMTLIRSLPEQDHHFTSALMMQDKLTKSTIQEAFKHEEILHRNRASAPTTPMALAAVAPAVAVTQTAAPAQNARSGAPWKRRGNGNGSKDANTAATCEFCCKSGHIMQKCYKFLSQVQQFKEIQAGRAALAKEFAGNASHRSKPLCPTSMLPFNSHIDWNADTGATSHMTPHRHFLRNYRPHRVAIQLADNTIVYSAGVGCMVFIPVIGGQEMRPIEFNQVLHVPDLQNNLLSVLFLTRHRNYTVHITDKAMHFMQGGKELFIAAINNNDTAFLSGTTQCAPEKVFSALAPTSTVPLSFSLWHQRFSHHSWDTVKRMHSQELVQGMDVHVEDKADPICEPCLAGKLSAAPFKSSASRASQPLELIHSDLHGPLKTSTHDGYRYWITFIDDCTKFRVLLLLKRKSEAFGAFKRFKAYAENQLNAKIKALQDDKGGEYMSNEFEQLCIDSGIARRHSVRNRPQQNGAAEILFDLMTGTVVDLLQCSYRSQCLVTVFLIFVLFPLFPHCCVVSISYLSRFLDSYIRLGCDGLFPQLLTLHPRCVVTYFFNLSFLYCIPVFIAMLICLQKTPLQFFFQQPDR